MTPLPYPLASAQWNALTHLPKMAYGISFGCASGKSATQTVRGKVGYVRQSPSRVSSRMPMLPQEFNLKKEVLLQDLSRKQG
jgi:hypothetical protein